MIKIEIELHDDVVSIINKLKNLNDSGIEIIVPENAVLFENVLNLKIIKKWAEREGKAVSFSTSDVNGQNLLSSLEEKDSQIEVNSVEEKPKSKRSIPKVKISLPNLNKLPIVILILLVLGIGGFFGFKYIATLPHANVKVVVHSQPLTRSIEIKVKAATTTDIENKILAGSTVSASVEKELSKETTGEKIIGEKAEGAITIFNKTNEEKKFKKGTDVFYKDDKDKEYGYELKGDVTVPAREETPGENPGDPGTFVNGKATVEIEADEIGKDYNVDKGEKFTIEDQETDDFEAEVTEDIEGGKEEKIKTVAQADIDELKEKLTEDAKEGAMRALTDIIPQENKLIGGSETVQATNEKLSKALNEETDEVKLEQTFSAKGLTYNPDELNKMIDKIVESFVPEGFILSTKERSVNVEVLGNSDATTLSDTEADLQVTLKTFVIPDISEESIMESLFGKSAEEAQRILGSIRNVKTYEFGLSPRIPFLDFVPKDAQRIQVQIERD